MATIVTRAGKGAALTHQEVDANFTGLNTELGQKEVASNKGVANGYASLDAAGKVPSAQLPSYVDDVVEVANFASLPGTGETGKIYVTIDTNKTYRWSGSSYIEISASPGSTDSLAEGSTNLYFTQARARASVSASGSLSYNSSTGVFSFSDAVTSVAGRTGAVTLTSSDVGLGNVENKSSATIRGELTSSNVTTALGYTPYNATNPSGYITSSASITGNAATATALQTARTINGVSFNGTANITVADSTKLPLSGGTMTGAITFPSGTPYQVLAPGSGTYNKHVQYISGTEYTLEAAMATDSISGTKLPITFTWRGGYAATGGLQITGSAAAALGGNAILHAANYNSYSPTLTGTGASGTWGISITGSSASTTGNAATATALQTARTINGVSFDGTANITVADSTKLPLSGGTVTGAVSMTADAQGHASPTLYVRGDIRAQRGTGGSGVIYFGNSSGTYLYYDGANYFMPSGQLDVNGSRVLHAGNYSSYALPLSGGTLTGRVIAHINSRTTSYTGSNFELYTSDNTPPGISFHRGGYSATLLYENDGRLFLNAWTTRAQSGELLTTGNYNSYSPTLTGSGASGTWGVNVTGYSKWIDRVPAYQWSNATLPSGYNSGVETSFVSAGEGFPNYGVVLSVMGRLPGDPGGNFQLFMGHGTNYGGTSLRVRSVDQSGNVWTSWKPILDSSNYNSYSPTLTGTGASGTWGISITGNAATATSADQIDGWGFRNTGSNASVNADTIESNGITYYTAGVPNFSGNSTDGALYSQMYSSSWQHQIAADYRSGQIALRGKNAGNWQSWRTVLDSSNYSSYALPLSGGTVTGSLTVNNSLSFGGFSQNLPESGLWSYITNYAYDPVNSVRWYWHKLCNLPDTSYALIEYHAKDDSNYPRSVRGYIDVASYNNSSVSIKHDAIIGFNGSQPQVRIDNNNDVWLRFPDITWNSYTAWRVLHRQAVTFYRNETKQFDTPANSIELLPGQQVRATRGSVTGASVENTTTYAGYLYSRSNAQIDGYIGIGQGPNSSYRVITNGHMYANSNGNVYAEGRHYSRHGTGTFYESLTTGNYTSYSPSLTGSGASGSWGISVTGSSASCTGNAATATTLATARTINGVSFNGSANITVADSTKLPLAGGTMTGALNFASIDQGAVLQHNGNAAAWYGRILTKNSTNDRAAFLGTYLGLAGVFAHNNALNAWAPLYVNTVDASSWGGAVILARLQMDADGTDTWYRAQNGNRHRFSTTGGADLIIGNGSGVATLNGNQLLTAGNYSSYAIPLSGGVNLTGSFGLNDRKLFLRGDGDTNHYLWNADDDWEELVAYSGTGFRVKSSTGGHLLTVSPSAVNAGVALQQGGNQVLHAGNYTSYTGGLSAVNTWTSSNYFRSNRNTTSSDPPLQAYSNDAGGAIMAFHRGGVYAVNFGLDSDNVIRIGGWSASTNRLQMDMSGNLTMAGNVTAYSDERLKKDWAGLHDEFVERLACIVAGTYTRIDSGERQAGVSAQAIREILPEVVSEDNEGTLGLAYGNAALVSAVELAKELVALKHKVAELEARVH